MNRSTIPFHWRLMLNSELIALPNKMSHHCVGHLIFYLFFFIMWIESTKQRRQLFNFLILEHRQSNRQHMTNNPKALLKSLNSRIAIIASVVSWTFQIVSLSLSLSLPFGRDAPFLMCFDCFAFFNHCLQVIFWITQMFIVRITLSFI